MQHKLSLTATQPASPSFSSFDFIDWTPEGVCLDEELFFPHISENAERVCSLDAYNTLLLSLADPADRDVWKKGKNVCGMGKKILWDLSAYVALLMEEKKNSSFEEVFSYVSKKLEELLPRMAETKPLAVILGKISPQAPFLFADEKALYEKAKRENDSYSLFGYELFLHFIEQLSLLFTGLQTFIAVDFSGVSLDTALLLSSQEYFERVGLFSLGFCASSAFLWKENEQVKTHFAEQEEEVKTALLLPPGEKKLWQDPSLLQVASLLKEKNIPYKAIAEPFFHLEWSGIERVVVFSSYLTKEGLRRVQGFMAAEGEVVVVGDSLDIATQTPYEKFAKLL